MLGGGGGGMRRLKGGENEEDSFWSWKVHLKYGRQLTRRLNLV